MKKKLVDPKCYELAAHFLAAKDILVDLAVMDLAVDFQNAAEDFLRNLESERTCAACGEVYDMDFDQVPTKYCNDCAHVKVEELERELQIIRDSDEPAVKLRARAADALEGMK